MTRRTLSIFVMRNGSALFFASCLLALTGFAKSPDIGQVGVTSPGPVFVLQTDPPRSSGLREIDSVAYPSVGDPSFRPVEMIKRAVPMYPKDMVEAGIEGTCKVRVTISARGIPTNILIVSSSGYPSLDGTCITAARESRYRPARKKRKAVAQTVVIPYRFVLAD